jgi:hypothetical protein
MTTSSLGKGVMAFPPPPPQVSIRLLGLGESHQGHEVFHYGALFELVFDGVRMVWICRFEKFFEVLARLSYLVLEVTLGGRYILLRAVHFLVVVVAAGSNFDPLGHCPPPPFATFGTFLNVFACSFGRCHPATSGDHFPITLNKNGHDHLFVRSVPGGDIKQLLDGLQLIMAKFMH